MTVVDGLIRLLALWRVCSFARSPSGFPIPISKCSPIRFANVSSLAEQRAVRSEKGSYSVWKKTPLVKSPLILPHATVLIGDCLFVFARSTRTRRRANSTQSKHFERAFSPLHFYEPLL